LSFTTVARQAPLRLYRSKLFVPGSRPALFEKAAAGPADVVCLDLEGVEELHAERGGQDLGRLTVWAKREVVTPWERKRTGALVAR